MEIIIGLGVGIALGMYISSQIKCHIRSSINRKELIDNEVDRLEYLISYCLKNYYINQANMIEEGKFVPKWKYEEMERQWNGSQGALQNLSVTVNGERYKII